MRLSDWRITWTSVEGSTDLLGFDEDMDEEISLNGQWLTPVAKSDFALRSVALPRGNHRARLDFSVRRPQATAAASWLAALADLKAAPYHQKGVLEIRLREIFHGQSFAAVLLNSSHAPALLDGIIETRSQYSFRIQKI
jgi:hypothetical protein